MHEIKRAIIVAAGMGKRMQPLSFVTPKPLIKVNGVRMIDTVIRALHANGIYEIYLVAGYLKEQFSCLEKEYPGLTLIENPYYDRCNNISSLYVARDKLGESMILDADQIIRNEKILSRFFERSGYNCVWTGQETKEWLLTAENGIVTHCSRTGGAGGFQLYSISRWTKKDGERLRRHIETEFEKKRNTQIYWDDVALFCYPEQYQLGIYEMEEGDVIEIDNIEELAAMDKTYEKFLGGADDEKE